MLTYRLPCPRSEGQCCDWVSLTEEAGLSSLQVVVGGVQTHLRPVGGVYPSFYLARGRGGNEWLQF